MKNKPQGTIRGRRQVVRIFGVTMGFVEGLERYKIIKPKNVWIGKQMWKVFSAKDVNKIKEEALGSFVGSCRERGKKMSLHLASKGEK